jgi:hypothetical protein
LTEKITTLSNLLQGVNDNQNNMVNKLKTESYINQPRMKQKIAV